MIGVELVKSRILCIYFSGPTSFLIKVMAGSGGKE